jgi:tRNA(fMet)-specific endonuclease VapC
MRKIVLDTNAYTRLLLGDEGILDALAKADIVWVPVFVLGELYAGF